MNKDTILKSTTKLLTALILLIVVVSIETIYLMSKVVKKICLIGPESVGKTSMIRRYVDNAFDEKYISTIGVSISNKNIIINGDCNLEIVLWDLEGFRNKGLHFPTSYLNGASGFVFVSDVTRPELLESTHKICMELYEKFEDKRCFSLALNKTDLVTNTSELTEAVNAANDIFEKCKPLNTFCTSAKSDHNISTLFENLGSSLVNNKIPNFRS